MSNTQADRLAEQIKEEASFNDCDRSYLHKCIDQLAALAKQQASPMSDALEAGDGTLHGAIDHWQERALKAETKLVPLSDERIDVVTQAQWGTQQAIMYQAYRAYARAILAEAGIKEKTNG